MTETKTVEGAQTDRKAAADLARVVYGARIANNIADGTIEHHHFIDAMRVHRLASQPLSTDIEAEANPEVTFEVWEDDLCVVSSTSEADARDYHAVYSQDAPVRLVKATTYRAALKETPNVG